MRDGGLKRGRQAPRWQWPLPALAAWGGGWAVVLLASGLGAAPAWALLLGLLPGLALAFKAAPGWRRALVVLGLPVMLLVQGGLAAVPSWAWLAAAALLLALYPVQAWRDAPLYPTAPDALIALSRHLPLPDGARVLDAGSGLGHGLVALRRAYPTADLLGVERSLLLRTLSRLRRFSPLRGSGGSAGPAGLGGPRGTDGLGGAWRVTGGDFWVLSWRAFDLVYLFQRPETMPGAWRKACEQMRPGAWLVSLEFAVPGRKPDIELQTPGGRWLGAYRIPEPGISVSGNGGR